MTIGDRIRRIRKKRRLTQAELAMMSGLSLSAIQGYEQGRYEPKRKPLESIAEVFKIPVDELYDMPAELGTNLASLGTDCISRQQAIDAAIDAADDWDGGYSLSRADMIERAINNLPSAQPEPRWIPCSERLPEEDGLYLVTSREKATAEEFGFDLDDVEVRKMRFNEDGWRIPKHIPEWINGVVHTTVLAWMPLPKPYREERTEE